LPPSAWVRDLIASGAVRIEPAERRNEVLALIDAGLDDFSASRAPSRSRPAAAKDPSPGAA
jgi:methionyl-tRNA synthetase